MTAILARPARTQGVPGRIFRLSALFWAFSYVLLSIRGSILFDDWGRLLDSHRALTVTIGAGAYALVLKQLDAGVRLSFRSALVWIAAATMAVMVVRVALDELLFDFPQGVAINILWSLTWSAYFALWVMGSLAFTPTRQSLRVAVSARQSEPTERGSRPDSFELLAELILAEASSLTVADRRKLAGRILELGGYEAADPLGPHNDRARLAQRIAARLCEGP